MIGRIVHTSVRIGLGTGAGFQPVVQTKSLPSSVVEHAVRETGYAHPFPRGDKRNPVVFLHRTVVLGGQSWHFLIRINDAVSDHNGRSNRLSQCVVVDDPGLAALKGSGTGPCEVLLGFPWEASWPNDRKPFVEEECPQPQSVALPSGVCKAWQLATGDAGWAGELALSVGKKQKVVVVAGPEHDTLALFAEALALLPPAVRWQVTFTTCQMDPSDVTWRAVRSDIKHQAPDPDTELVIDLAAIKAAGRKAPSSRLADRARGVARISVTPKPSGDWKPRKRLKIDDSDPSPTTSQVSDDDDDDDDDKPLWPFVLGGVSVFVLLVLILLPILQTNYLLNRYVIPSRKHEKVIFGKSSGRWERAGNAAADSGKRAAGVDGEEESVKAVTVTGESSAKTNDMPQQSSRSPEQSAVAGGTPLEPTSPGSVVEEPPDKLQEESKRKAKEEKDWRAKISRGSPNLQLPINLNGGEQSLGIPWSWAIDLAKAELLIQPLEGDPTKLVVGLPEKTASGIKWMISEQRTKFGYSKKIPVATVFSKDNQLFWEWRPHTNPATAITVLFSTISFPQLLPDQKFYFRKGQASPFTKTFVVSDLPDVGEGRGNSGQVKLPDDVLADAFGGVESYHPSVSELLDWCNDNKNKKALRLDVRLRCEADSSEWRSKKAVIDTTTSGPGSEDILSANLQVPDEDYEAKEISENKKLVEKAKFDDPKNKVVLKLQPSNFNTWFVEKQVELVWPDNWLRAFGGRYLRSENKNAKNIIEKKESELDYSAGKLPPELSGTDESKAGQLFNFYMDMTGVQRVEAGLPGHELNKLLIGLRNWGSLYERKQPVRVGANGVTEEDYRKFVENKLPGILSSLPKVKKEIKGKIDFVKAFKLYMPLLRDRYQKLLANSLKVNVSIGLMKSQSEQDGKFDVPLVGVE